MTAVANSQVSASPVRTSIGPRVSWAWLGVVPFFAFATAFLIAPAVFLLVGSFFDPQDHFTFKNFSDIFQQNILDAYWLSIQISLVTALGGGALGFMLAYAIVLGGLPRFVRTGLMTFSGVASNFAGIPLAFAFIATLGRTGFMTALLRDILGDVSVASR